MSVRNATRWRSHLFLFRKVLFLSALRRTDWNVHSHFCFFIASMRVRRSGFLVLPKPPPPPEFPINVLTVEKTVIRFRANGLMDGRAKRRMIPAIVIQDSKQTSGERPMPATPFRSQTTFPTRFERSGFSSGRIRTAMRPSEPVVSRFARNRSAAGPIPAVRQSLGSCQIVQSRGAITWP